MMRRFSSTVGSGICGSVTPLASIAKLHDPHTIFAYTANRVIGVRYYSGPTGEGRGGEIDNKVGKLKKTNSKVRKLKTAGKVDNNNSETIDKVMSQLQEVSSGLKRMSKDIGELKKTAGEIGKIKDEIKELKETIQAIAEYK
eukprot:Tbor_TRINITY_DN6048_c0_g1::TRINITY_DN6048_c0_g1_i16::g.11493::m.11493